MKVMCRACVWHSPTTYLGPKRRDYVRSNEWKGQALSLSLFLLSLDGDWIRTKAIDNSKQGGRKQTTQAMAIGSEVFKGGREEKNKSRDKCYYCSKQKIESKVK